MKFSIALCFDANYQVQTRTVMQSVVDYGLPDSTIDFFLITEDKSGICVDAFNSLAGNRVTVNFVSLSQEYRDYITQLYTSLRCSKKKYISSIALAKCLLPLLIQDCGKLLYLDSDMLVVNNISGIWDIDMKGYRIAAVPDLKLSKNSDNRGILFSGSDRYFNSGLLLFNLGEIEKTTLLKDLAEVYACRDRKYNFVDQDQLNVLYGDSVKYLPVEYNLFARFPNAGKEGSIDITELFSNTDAVSQMGNDVSPDEVQHAVKNPKIVHFVTRRKPWNSFEGFMYERWRSVTCRYNWSGYFLERDIRRKQRSIKLKEKLWLQFLNRSFVRKMKALLKKYR
ncbi:MAG: glycosyltransferase family 8 protein [Spirochaetales bacterium]|nr:glycosyltransferase family 8 protein [Spirochaetales bacterium]